MAVSQVSAALNLSINDACRLGASKSLAIPRLCASSFAPMAASFLQGTPLAIRTSYPQSIRKLRARAASIRCEQSANEGNSLDVWLGRLAMVGFAVAISVEIATGKGLLENFGVMTPLPTVALAVTGLVGVLTAIFIFQSASKN